MGILQFLSNTNNTNNTIEQIRYQRNIIGMSKIGIKTIINKIFKKTIKKDVKDLLNIPIFGEEIIYVEQTNIERNIYNTIRCSRHFTESVRIRRLFLMCTNILINEGYDLDNNNEISTEELTLEQLNANMINKFTQQLSLLDNNKDRTHLELVLLDVRIKDWINIVKYIENLKLDELIDISVLSTIRSSFDDTYKNNSIFKPNIKYNCDLMYNVLNIFEVWHNHKDIGTILLANISIIKDKLFRIWHKTWDNEINLIKC